MVNAESTGANNTSVQGGGGSGFLYTGAKVRGTVTLSAEGYPTLTWDLGGRREPGEYSDPSHRAPYNAPFIYAVASDLNEAFAAWFERSNLDLKSNSIPTAADWTPADLAAVD